MTIDPSSALQILGVIVESYATMLSIVSMFYVLLLQYLPKKDFKYPPLKGWKRIFSSHMFWAFFIFSSFVLAFSLITMLLIGTNTLTGQNLMNALTSTVLLAIMGLFPLRYTIRDMIRLMA